MKRILFIALTLISINAFAQKSALNDSIPFTINDFQGVIHIFPILQSKHKSHICFKNSKSYRLFLQYTGERPLAYVQQKRIERAQYLITTTDKTHSEIAEETGFENVPH
ncbi:MAG: helix-turn-helix domain-containing protein, partial [Pedobacter sp.]